MNINPLDKYRKIGGVEFGPTRLISWAEYTLNRFNGLNIKMHPNDRLHCALRLIKEIKRKKIIPSQDDDLFLKKIAEANKTIFENNIIARAHGQHNNILSNIHRRKLEEMLSGALLPGEDRNTFARDVQFEVFLAAWFIMGNVPIIFDEPDLRIPFLGQECGVAAKRVKSQKKVIKLVLKAANQIKTAGIPGFIAVNIDVLQKEVAGTSKNEDNFRKRKEIVREVELELKKETGVLGFLIFGSDCFWDFTRTPPLINMSQYFDIRLFLDNQVLEERGQRFFQNIIEYINIRLNKL